MNQRIEIAKQNSRRTRQVISAFAWSEYLFAFFVAVSRRAREILNAEAAAQQIIYGFYTHTEYSCRTMRTHFFSSSCYSLPSRQSVSVDFYTPATICAIPISTYEQCSDRIIIFDDDDDDDANNISDINFDPVATANSPTNILILYSCERKCVLYQYNSFSQG